MNQTHAGLFFVFGTLSSDVQQTPQMFDGGQFHVVKTTACRGIGRASIHHENSS